MRKYLLFTHFDEVWLFRDEPLEPKPEKVTYVLSPYNLNEEMPPEVAKWLYHSGCI